MKKLEQLTVIVRLVTAVIIGITMGLKLNRELTRTINAETDAEDDEIRELARNLRDAARPPRARSARRTTWQDAVDAVLHRPQVNVDDRPTASDAPPPRAEGA